MQNLNNDAYECLLGDLIHDAFYTDISNRGKIMLLRAYAEVIIRQIFSIPVGEYMTLGKNSVKNAINSTNNPLFINAWDNIRDKGDAATHTEDVSSKTDTDVTSMTESIFDILAYLFIKFFDEYSFGTNPAILTAFSILPPIIRYKVLTCLYEKAPDNVDVIDKLALATLKAKGKSEALDWVNKEATHLMSLASITKSGEESILLKLGDVIGKQVINSARNMYDSCIDKINKVDDDTHRAIYDDFESALPYYKEYGILKGTSQDEAVFNSIMEFLYLGRQGKSVTTQE